MFSIDYVGMSHRGMIRTVNQDNLVCQGKHLPIAQDGLQSMEGRADLTEPLLFGVFDGLGGEQCGEVASFMAAQAAAQWEIRPTRDALKALCLDINRDICAFTERNAFRVCGTTAAMLLFDPARIISCNLGDSRIYAFRQERLDRLSTDHVLPMYPGPKPPLTQFLGIPETEVLLEPAFTVSRPENGEEYLICSDGLYDAFPDASLQHTLRKELPLGSKAEELLWGALNAGGRDNISFILLRLKQ